MTFRSICSHSISFNCLNVVKEKLQFETDLLLKELEEQRSQLTLRKIAIGKLNMITPSNKNLIFINKKGKMHE